MSDTFTLALCTVPSQEVAETLARGLVGAGLAACVNVVPGVKSYYVWNGALEVSDELQLLVKTRAVHHAAIAAWLEEHHPYDVPEVLFVPIAGGSERYLAWVAESTRGGRP